MSPILIISASLVLAVKMPPREDQADGVSGNLAGGGCWLVADELQEFRTLESSLNASLRFGLLVCVPTIENQ